MTYSELGTGTFLELEATLKSFVLVPSCVAWKAGSPRICDLPEVPEVSRSWATWRTGSLTPSQVFLSEYGRREAKHLVYVDEFISNTASSSTVLTVLPHQGHDL